MRDLEHDEPFAASSRLPTESRPETSSRRRYHSSTSPGRTGVDFQSTTIARSDASRKACASGGTAKSASFAVVRAQP